MEQTNLRNSIIQAGYKAVEELIKVAEENIIGAKGTMIIDGEEVPLNSEDLPADKLKNAAATKKLAIFDAFEILNRIEQEKEALSDEPKKEEEKPKTFLGFAERRAK